MIALLGLLLSCQSDPRPSILLVTLDTTRADRLGAYGYPLARTPAIDGLARGGVVFERAYASSVLTIPSHATIMTGLNPPEHGVRYNGDRRLSEDSETLAESLRARGYQTAAFTSAFPTQRRWGFAQGFDRYFDPSAFAPHQRDWRDQRRATTVVNEVLANPSPLGEPEFIWVHLFDPHWPYSAPEEWTDGPGDAYDAEIAYMDSQLLRLFSWWNGRHPGGVIALTADHGEGLGDGGEQTHGNALTDGTLHVPLIVSGLGVPSGLRRSEPVGHTALMPTLIGLADGDARAGLLGAAQVTPIYSEAMAPLYGLGIQPLVGFTEREGRYVEGVWSAYYPEKSGKIADKPLSDVRLTLKAHRLDELIDGMRAGDATEALESDRIALQSLGYLSATAVSVPLPIDPRDVIEAIPLIWQARTSLSQGQIAAAIHLSERLDSSLGETVAAGLLRADLLLARGDVLGAETALLTLEQAELREETAFKLAALYARAEDWWSAVDYYERCLERAPDSARALLGLARAYVRAGEEERAESLAERSLALYADYGEMYLLKAEIARREGRLSEALDWARRAVKARPDRVEWAGLIAQLYWEMGEVEDALDWMDFYLAQAPAQRRARRVLAGWLEEVGRRSEATDLRRHLAGGR